MEYITLPNTNVKVSKISLGCMRLKGKSVEQIEMLLKNALELGINYFDHADVYGHGECESLFGEVLKRNPQLRKKMIIQTKCDIVPVYNGGQRYDTSKEYIKKKVKESLRKLNVDYIDILLLHRPDPLCNPIELSETFSELQEEGMVKYFGVSNHSVGKMKLLQKYLKQPLVINQMQFSIIHSHMVDSDIFLNMDDSKGIDRDNGMIDYCHYNEITIQTWCSLQASWMDGTFIDNPKFPKLNAVLEELANKYKVAKSAIAIAWILRHPANMIPVTGTTSIDHLKQACEATNVKLTRQEWFDLYMAEDKLVP